MFLHDNHNMAVLGRNQTLFRCVFWSHYCVQSALARCVIYPASMSTALNRSFTLERFERCCDQSRLLIVVRIVTTSLSCIAAKQMIIRSGPVQCCVHYTLQYIYIYIYCTAISSPCLFYPLFSTFFTFCLFFPSLFVFPYFPPSLLFLTFSSSHHQLETGIFSYTYT